MTALLSGGFALLGVVVGGGITSRLQHRHWLRTSRRDAYVEFLSDFHRSALIWYTSTLNVVLDHYDQGGDTEALENYLPETFEAWVEQWQHLYRSLIAFDLVATEAAIGKAREAVFGLAPFTLAPDGRSFREDNIESSRELVAQWHGEDESVLWSSPLPGLEMVAREDLAVDRSSILRRLLGGRGTGEARAPDGGGSAR